ncbi:hypothetical protein [Williamsia muralis]|uniref:hypothetical protein n=1 Tax=Williamsia marianensis TaxID=85044 RepID=UPI00295509F4|nr:hypothetical protein [Williamsia muralis]
MATRKLTKEDARRLARTRQAAVQAEVERKEREQRELREAERKQRLTANEEAMVSFYQHESAIEAAEQHLKDVTAESQHQMGLALAEIVEREGSVSAAAKLLGISPSRVKALVQLADTAPAGTPPVAQPADPPATSTDRNNRDEVIQDGSGEGASALGNSEPAMAS